MSVLVVVAVLLLILVGALTWALVKAERAPCTMAEIERHWDGKERRRIERRKDGAQ